METSRPGFASIETEPETLESIQGGGPVPFALTVVFHIDLERIGERAYLGFLGPGERHRLGRHEPLFSAPRQGIPRPLRDLRLSRQGVELRSTPDGLWFDATGASNSVIVEGQPVVGRWMVEPEALEHGISITLSRRVVLLLHRHDPITDLTYGLGLVGESAGLVRVRNEIATVARAAFPVLIRGETGTGKELVAEAIARHPANPRRDGSFVVRNMATIGPEMAVAELFGAHAGAYTGQRGDRRGAFREADSGTLFLDEIGDTPRDVQPMLLRALETGEVMPLAGDRPIPVDVRILSATDLDLDTQQASERFRSPLRHRLAGFEIALPPLRERRDDLGRLVVHFMRLAFEETGETQRLEERFHDFPWLPASWVSELLRCPWPGNIRQLQNVIRRWVLGLVESRWEPDFAELAARVEGLVRSHRPGPVEALPAPVLPPTTSPPGLRTPSPGTPSGPGKGPSTPSREAFRQPAEIGRDELLGALDQARWTVSRAALILGIGRTSIYQLLRRHGLRTNSSIGAEEILAARGNHGGDLEATARALGVSLPGLVARMTTLNLR